MTEETCKCGAKLIPDIDSSVATGVWDGHTYKYDCDCMPDIRVSKG